MVEKTLSQKIARGLEITDYFLLIPAAFGVFWATICIFAAPLFTLIIWLIAAIGVILMVGYFKHSRSRLNEKYLFLVWGGTVLYNFLLSIPFLYYTFILLKEPSMNGLKIDANLKATVILIICSTFYLVIVTLAAVAYKSARQKLN